MRGSPTNQIKKGTRRTYNMNFKKEVSRKNSVPWVNICSWRKDSRNYKNELFIDTAKSTAALLKL